MHEVQFIYSLDHIFNIFMKLKYEQIEKDAYIITISIN